MSLQERQQPRVGLKIRVAARRRSSAAEEDVIGIGPCVLGDQPPDLEPLDTVGTDACASRLLSGGKIQARVAELRQAISTHTVEKTSVSKAWVIAKLVENVERAMQAVPVLDRLGNPAGDYTYQGNVANRALELIGKEYGMFIDRKEIGGAGAFDHLDDDELNKTIEALAEEVQEIEQALLPPVALYPASSQAEKTHFHQINRKTGHRLRQQMVDEVTGEIDRRYFDRPYYIAPDTKAGRCFRPSVLNRRCHLVPSEG